MRRKAPRREAEKKRQARQRAARDLAETIKRFGLHDRQPSGGIMSDPLAAKSFVQAKRSRIAPAYNKGALQYLPANFNKPEQE